MKTARLMDGAAYLMSAAHQRPEDDDQPTELGQRLLDKWAARDAAKKQDAAKEAAARLTAVNAYQDSASAIPAHFVEAAA